MSEENLEKVHIDLGDDPDAGGESMWALPLGDDLFELRNTPFHAYALNFRDVVKAVSRAPSLKPSILEVVRRSGHRTIWIAFASEVPTDRCEAYAASLNEWRAYFEGADKRYFAIDVEPDGDYSRVLAAIESWLRQGVLKSYRTGPDESEYHAT